MLEQLIDNIKNHLKTTITDFRYVEDFNAQISGSLAENNQQAPFDTPACFVDVTTEPITYTQKSRGVERAELTLVLRLVQLSLIENDKSIYSLARKVRQKMENFKMTNVSRFIHTQDLVEPNTDNLITYNIFFGVSYDDTTLFEDVVRTDKTIKVKLTTDLRIAPGVVKTIRSDKNI